MKDCKKENLSGGVDEDDPGGTKKRNGVDKKSHFLGNFAAILVMIGVTSMPIVSYYFQRSYSFEKLTFRTEIVKNQLEEQSDLISYLARYSSLNLDNLEEVNQLVSNLQDRGSAENVDELHLLEKLKGLLIERTGVNEFPTMLHPT